MKNLHNIDARSGINPARYYVGYGRKYTWRIYKSSGHGWRAYRVIDFTPTGCVMPTSHLLLGRTLADISAQLDNPEGDT